MNLKIKDIEKKLGFKLKKNVYVLGVDTASVTGLCIAETDKNSLKIKTSLFKLPKLNKEEEFADKYVEKLEFMLRTIREFKKSLKPKQKSILVLEQSFLGFFFNKKQVFANAVTFGLLRALQGICFAELFDIFEIIKIPLATTARKEVGFKSKLKKGTKREEKKQEIIDWINQIFGTKEENDNITDSILLALYGLKEV